MFRCATAATLPTIMVSRAMAARIHTQSAWRDGRAKKKMRSRAAKAAALVPAIMKAVTDVGAPS